MNQVVLIGRLTKDPELKYIPSTGTPVANFTLAVDRDYSKKDGTRPTDFIPIEVMGKSAEFCANYLSKGRLISIVGAIRVEQYKNQAGENRTFTKVHSNNVNVLDSNKDKNKGNNGEELNPIFEPSFGSSSDFDPSVLDPNGFQAIDDEDLPF